MWAWGSTFIEVEGGAYGFLGSHFIGEFKTWREFKAQEQKIKTSGLNGQLQKSSKMSKTMGPGALEVGGQALHRVLWLALCLLEVAVLDVDASSTKA